MSTELAELGAVPASWTRRHLLGLEELSAEEITTILDKAQVFRDAMAAGRQKTPLLVGKTCVNLFFENSTRTRTSFSLAARRLGADTIDFSASTSSLSKGETVIDTAKNIEAMGVDAMIVRHRTPGTPNLLAENLNCSVINAGDGPHEHPTQGLLDILTIRQRKGRIEGLTVALVGDIAHSRTARSNIWGLKKLGAHVIVCGPSTLVSPRWAEIGVEYSLQPGRDPAPGRRAQPAADPVRAAVRAAVPVGPRIRPSVRDEPRPARPDQGRHPDPGPRPDQPRRGSDPRRGRRPALGDPRTSDQRLGGADGRVVAVGQR